jgi:hypothetical protein
MDGNSLDSWFMIGAIFLAAGREKNDTQLPLLLSWHASTAV